MKNTMVSNVITAMSNSIKHTLTGNPKLYKQNLYNSNPFMVVTGPAGSGKTMLACGYALERLKNKDVEKIVLTRPTITVDNENIGFLPGDMQEKMNPYMVPIYDYLRTSKENDISSAILSNVEICPLAFSRGRTFDNCIIIADEMQNATKSQLMTLMTRIGHGSKMIITGDLMQQDIEDTVQSGMDYLIKKIKKEYIYTEPSDKRVWYDNERSWLHIDGLIDVIEFNNSDIKRNEKLSEIIELFQN